MITLFSDIDGTLLSKQVDVESENKFFDAIKQARENDPRFKLIYVTGRSLYLYRRINTRLPRPDYVVCAVGTEIYQVDRDGVLTKDRSYVPAGRWSPGYVYDLLASVIGVSRQVRVVEPQYQCGFDFDGTKETLDVVKRLILNSGIEAKIITSGKTLLDIIPLNMGKGEAVTRLSDDGTSIVAGDSGNDLSMMNLNFVTRIIPGNADHDLDVIPDGPFTIRTTGHGSTGVIEALKICGVIK